MNIDADVGVVGVGTMGSMTLWQLARRGVSAIGLEQFRVGHEHGAGVGESRQYRAEYLEDEVRDVMALATQEYRALEHDSGLDLLTIAGGLTIGSPESQYVSELLQRIRATGQTPKILGRDEMARRYPQHTLAKHDVVVWNPGSGYVQPEHAIVAASAEAQRRGTTIVPHCPVTGITSHAGHVEVHTSSRVWRFRTLIVTTGAWTWRLLSGLVPGADVGRLVLTWFPVQDRDLFTAERFPTFTRVFDEAMIYGMPSLADGSVRVGITGPRAKFADPDSLERIATPQEIDTITRLVRRWMPHLVPTVIRTGVHMDAYTPDGQPVIGPVDDHGRVLVAAGFSGRGFKMAPVVGKVLAQLALDRHPSTNIDHWRPDRFNYCKWSPS